MADTEPQPQKEFKSKTVKYFGWFGTVLCILSWGYIGSLGSLEALAFGMFPLVPLVFFFISIVSRKNRTAKIFNYIGFSIIILELLGLLTGNY